MSIAVTAQDTLKINGRLLLNFADQDCAKITFPNELGNVKTGKNGNSIIAYSYQGKNGVLETRLLLGSSDDKFLNGLLNQYNNNPASFPLLSMEFDKNIGDGNQNIVPVIYLGIGGIFSKQPEVFENADGETNQAVVVWTMKFTRIDRSIG